MQIRANHVMKTLVVAGLAATVLAVAPALGADLVTKAPVAPVTSWTGFYAGVNAGYGFGDASTTATPGDPNGQRPIFGIVNVATASSTFDRSGGLGGVQAGYNWQFSPRWVAGIEADFDWADLAGDGASATTLFGGSNPATFSASQKIEWLGTLRARLGYLSTENLLLFATGGLAYGKVNETTSTALPAGATNSIGNFNYGYGLAGSMAGRIASPGRNRAPRWVGAPVPAPNLRSAAASPSSWNIFMSISAAAPSPAARSTTARNMAAY
jgi:outer membrane immunogenic protein